MKRIEALIPQDKLQLLLEALEENNFNDVIHSSAAIRGAGGSKLEEDRASVAKVELLVENEDEKLAVNIINRICRRKNSDIGKIIIYNSVKVITINNGNESL